MLVVTLVAVVAVVALAFGGFYLSARMLPSQRVAGQVTSATVTIAVSIILSVALHQMWEARRERDLRVWAARDRHLQQLHVLLRAESESLNAIAQALREGRYLTLMANDERKAVWQDDTLTADVERHFPEYFQERERLIRQVLEHDSELGRIRHIVSATLPLTAATEPYRSELVSAIVNKCGGAAPAVSFVRITSRSFFGQMPGRSSDSPSRDQSAAMADAVRTYDQYRCSADITRECQNLFDRAADLADAAVRAGEAARRYAEETVLHGSCTYAPPD